MEDLVGRGENKKELIEAIDFSNATYRVISIVGPPGVGKSTLAIHFANEIAKHADVCYFKLDEFPKGEFGQAFTKMLIGTCDCACMFVGIKVTQSCGLLQC